MKKQVNVFFLLSAISFTLFGQAKQPTSVSEKEVPKAVLKQFKEKRSAAANAIWYPYPNQYGKDASAAIGYDPIAWTALVQDFYEVRFTDAGGAVREVYDRSGKWKVTSRPIEEDLPVEITSQLSKNGYDAWKMGRKEIVSKDGQQGKFYKLWFNQDKKIRVLFFNESFALVKTLRWDNDLNLMVNVNAKMKEVSALKKSRRSVDPANVPVELRNKAKRNHVDIDIIQWYTYTRVFSPNAFDPSGFSYYDLQTPSFYQLIFSNKTGKFMASYTNEGELIELAQIITTKMLPKAIKNLMFSEDYISWKWEVEHEKVSVDEQAVFRVYGAENDTPSMVTLTSEGKRIPNK